MAETFELAINGAKVQVTAERNTPLLYVLRNHLGLKGTRFGCGDGNCGACTVIADGRAIYSCDTPVWSVGDKAIETIDGLSSNGELHPIQSAVLDEQAAQCGYCLSGIMMRAKALLDENPNPTRAEITAALDGSLCRCGAHNRMIRSVERAAKTMGGK